MPSPAPAARPAPRPAADTRPLRQRLAALRRRLRRTAVVRGVSWLVLFTVVMAAAACLLDIFLALPSLARAALLVGWLAGAGLIARRHLYRPLAQRCDDLSLALRVEQRFPSLNDALASTVQFLDAPAGEGGDSAGLRREAVKRALDRAKAFDFNRVVDGRGLRTAACGAVAAVAAAVTLTLIFPDPALSALVRLANPFNNRDQSTLEVDSPRERVALEETYEVQGHVRGVLPQSKRVEILVTVQDSTTEYSTDVAPDGRKSGSWSFQLPNKVQQPFRFHVAYNDAVSRDYDVTVLPPPGLARIGDATALQLQISYPRYTGLPSPEAQPAGIGDANVVVGTSVELRATADRPLRAAWVDYPADPRPAAAAAMGFVVRALPARADAEIDGNRASFVVRFRPVESGLYYLHLVDETGLGATLRYHVTVSPDPKPTVDMDRPSQTHDVLSVLQTASLPLHLVAQDPPLDLSPRDRVAGLRSVWLEYRAPGEGSPTQRLLLHDASTLAPAMGPPVEAVGPPLRPSRLEFDRKLAVSSLRRPDGSSPREGDVILLQAVADDWDDVSPDKGPGRSVPVVEIHIVRADELDIVQTQAEAAVQQKLQRLREKELEALQHVEDAKGQIKQIEKLQPKEGDQSDEAKKQREEIAKLQADAARELTQAQQLQREIEDGLGDKDGNTGLRVDVAKLLDSLEANGRTNAPARDRMERVEQELHRLGAVELQQIDAKLTEAKQGAARDAKPLDAKDKADRQNRKQEQAREFDRQGAGHLEDDAARQADAAAKADAAAEKARESKRPEEAERLHKEAEDLRKEAERQREVASALRKSAERERQGADVNTPAEAARDAAGAAEDMQQETAKILNDLQSYSSTREAKVEAGRILQDQRKLEAAADELEKQVLGKDAKDLTEAQRAALDELRDNQKRLEERTQQMLNRMKRTADLQKELEKLTKDQDDLQKDIKEAKTPRELERLSKRQKDLAEATKLKADELKRLGAEQAASVLSKAAEAMERTAERLDKGQKPDDAEAASKALQDAQNEKDPLGARELQDALDRANQADADKDEAGLQGDMKKAGEDLAGNRLAEAKKDQEKAAGKLQEMLQQLNAQEKQQREDDQDQLAKKLADKEKELEKLAAQQDELQKKIKDAKDPKELEQLAKQQKALADQTKQAADELQRLGAEKAGAAAKQAADAMAQNADRLQKGEKPEKVDEALDRLQDAQDEADDAQQDAQDQLEREKQARIAEEVNGLKERQEALNQQAGRLHDTLAKNEAKRDVLLNSVGGLRDAQNGLAGETEALAKKELADAPVLLRLTLRASESMTDAGARLDEGLKAKPAEVGDAALQAQRQASHRLGLVLDALKSQDAALPPPGGGQAGGPGGQNGGDPDTQPDSVPPVAQLKLLRAMQKEVNDRTAAFEKAHPDPAKYGDKEKAELEDIHKEQQDVVDLVEEFRHPSPPKKDGDKK